MLVLPAALDQQMHHELHDKLNEETRYETYHGMHQEMYHEMDHRMGSLGSFWLHRRAHVPCGMGYGICWCTLFISNLFTAWDSC